MKVKSFKKALLLCPQNYSLYNIFNNILKEICNEVISINIRNYVNKYEININTQIFRFPNSIRSKWLIYYQKKINNQLLNEYLIQKPDLVFIYNNEMLLPSTIKRIQKNTVIIFFSWRQSIFYPI